MKNNPHPILWKGRFDESLIAIENFGDIHSFSSKSDCLVQTVYPIYSRSDLIMASNDENVDVTYTEYRSKSLQTKVDNKHLVVVKVTSPYQEDVKRLFSKSIDETIQFRETIQKYIEQMLVELGDVKIVSDDIQDAWSHFIQIVFKIFYRPRENGTHLTFAKIGVCFYSQDHSGVAGFYNPIAEPTLDQLDEFCKNVVIDFYRQFLQPQREKEQHSLEAKQPLPLPVP